MEKNTNRLTMEIIELKKKLECYRFALEKVVTGVIIVDEDGVIFEYNRAASAFESLTAEKVIGKKSKDEIPFYKHFLSSFSLQSIRLLVLHSCG